MTSTSRVDLSRCVYMWTREQQPETDGGHDRENDGSNAPAAPGAEKDGAEPFLAEVWMTRAGGGMQKRFPAHATLTERVRRGNDLVGERDLRLAPRTVRTPAVPALDHTVYRTKVTAALDVFLRMHALAEVPQRVGKV